MNHDVVSGIVNNLPIEKMVAAPLMAAIKAQGEMSMQMARFIDNVGVDSDGNIRMVTFKYQENVTTPAVYKEDGSLETAAVTTLSDRYIQAPFLALTGIPNLAVEHINISFELEVSTAEDDKSKTESSLQNETSAEYSSWWSPVKAATKFTGSVTHSSEQTRHTDTRAKYSFNVSARKQAPPEAFMRIIDAITNGVANPTGTALTDNLSADGKGVKKAG